MKKFLFALGSIIIVFVLSITTCKTSEPPPKTDIGNFDANGIPSTDYSTVSLVQSTSVTQAANFTDAEIENLVRQAVTLAGGLEGIVKTGDVVVLKPNVIVTYYNWSFGGTPIPELVNGVCTDRRVIKAAAKIVREIVGPYNSITGAGKIMVIEGSGSGSTVTNFNNLGYNTANIPDVNEFIALENEGIWVSAGNASGSTEYVTQVTLQNYAYNGASGAYAAYYKNDGKYWVNKKMLEADALICLPVVKTHWNASVTGAIKNIGIGAAPPSIYGIQSTIVGRNNMVNHASNVNLHAWIADYFSCLPCDFVIMDGLQGIQHGPLPSFTVSGGVNNASQLAQHYKNLRCILASRDPLAIDIVEANIIGQDYTHVPYMATLAAKGTVGGKPNGQTITLRGDPKKIVVVGNKKVDDVRGEWRNNIQPNNSGRRIPSANKVAPTVTINSAAFSGNNLNLNLTLSANVVKVDVYINGNFTATFNNGFYEASIDTSSLAAGSHNIEVRVFNQHMYSATASTTAVK